MILLITKSYIYCCICSIYHHEEIGSRVDVMRVTKDDEPKKSCSCIIEIEHEVEVEVEIVESPSKEQPSTIIRATIIDIVQEYE